MCCCWGLLVRAFDGKKGGDRQDLQEHVGVVAGDGICVVRWGGEEESDEGLGGG